MNSALFEGIEAAAFADAAKIRERVFVQEQGFAQDLDEMDARALHVVCYRDGRPVATARAFPEEEGQFHIGRVAVIRELRGRGIGAALLGRLERALRERGAVRLTLGAQLHAVPFYEKLGYRPIGAIFDDAGAPHRRMEKNL